MARPKKGLETLPNDWKELVEEAYTEGSSDVEIRAMLRISEDLWYRWLDEEPEFSQTIKRCRQLCQAYWERMAREAAVGINKDANPTMMIFNLKNRFPSDWKDKRETDHTSSDGSMSPPTRIELVAPKNDDSSN